jgi:hypothetical protein
MVAIRLRKTHAKSESGANLVIYDVFDLQRGSCLQDRNTWNTFPGSE